MGLSLKKTQQHQREKKVKQTKKKQRTGCLPKAVRALSLANIAIAFSQPIPAEGGVQN